MKVAIFGQYYQNDTRPIIKDIFVFFNKNNVELVIEEKFLKILYEEKILEKQSNILYTSKSHSQAYHTSHLLDFTKKLNEILNQEEHVEAKCSGMFYFTLFYYLIYYLLKF